MIVTASPRHLDGIRTLWRQAFGDSMEYINLFLKHHAELQNTLVYLQDSAVAGMLFILPCRLVFHGLGYPCAYLYGIATRQAARGHGIATQLLQEAYRLCSSRGYAVCALVPATPALFQFYAKRGYANQGYAKTLAVDAAALPTLPAPVAFSAIAEAEIFAMRRAFFGAAFLEWDSHALAYILAENRNLGGSFYRYKLGESCGYLCCIPQHDTLIIKEFAGDTALLPELLRSLCEIYHKQSYLVRLCGAAAMGTLAPLAMTKWISAATQAPFYLSHVFD